MIDQKLCDDLKNKSVLITGATGFFGKNLIDDLLVLNHAHNLNLKIFAMSRRPLERKEIFSIAHDVSEKFNINESIDYLIHAATPVVYDKSTPDELLSITINGTKNAIDYAISHNVKKFLMVSSGAVYGVLPEGIQLITENLFEHATIFDSKYAYATGKRIAENLCHSYFKNSSVEYSIVRGFAFSGRYLALDQHLAIGNFVRDAIDTKEIIIKGNGLAERSYMDNEDLSNWLMTILLKSRSGEAYNLGSDRSISIKDLAYTVANHLDGVSVKILGSNEVQSKANCYVPNIEKAKKELNLKLTVDLNQTIEKMINLYRKEK